MLRVYIEDSVLTIDRLVFFYPLLGLINIFIYVLKDLGATSIPSDLALMDIVAGHFGYLEYYSSSRLSFPFVGELTSIARAAVKKSKDRHSDTLLPSQAVSMNTMGDHAFETHQDFMSAEVCP